MINQEFFPLLYHDYIISSVHIIFHFKYVLAISQKDLQPVFSQILMLIPAIREGTDLQDKIPEPAGTRS